MEMNLEMININANLVKEPVFSSFEKNGETIEVVNFTLVKSYGKDKEYTNCSAYGEKVELARELRPGDLKISSSNHITKSQKTRRKNNGIFCRRN